MKILDIIYHLAVSLWVGGAALFTFVLTPVLFRSESRDTAARIVGLFFPGYFRWGVACGVIALATALFRGQNFGLPMGILALMLALVSFQAFYVEPQAAELKKQIGSFEKTTKDHPLRQQFSRLHAFSATCNVGVITGGVVLVALF